MSESSYSPEITVLYGRRVLDTAEGVLIGLRHYHPDAAFAELIDASRRHAVPVFALASALIDLAGGARPPADAALPAWWSAQREWGPLLGASHRAAGKGSVAQ